MSKKILLTGASGFVGAHVLGRLLRDGHHVIAPVSFRHKGTPRRLELAVSEAEENESPGRVEVVRADLAAPADKHLLRLCEGVDTVMNVASESHVDRSILDPSGFIQNNVALMTTVLEIARAVQPRLFLQMSTDEVFGPADEGTAHLEWETHRPSNPYSASKSAQEAIAYAYWRTYGVPLVITNTMNIFGPTQDPEKFIPLAIRNLLAGRPVPVHTSPEGKAGSRFYLHAGNLADAWAWLMDNVPPRLYAEGAAQPLRYNVVGEEEVANDDLVTHLAYNLGVEARIERVDFHTSRPGHDLRYALDGSKLAKAGWKAPYPLWDSMLETALWFRRHPEWLL